MPVCMLCGWSQSEQKNSVLARKKEGRGGGRGVLGDKVESGSNAVMFGLWGV